MMSKTWTTQNLQDDEKSVGNAVRNTVRNMAYNLENVITNLHGIVGDLHILVAQIDNVTSKIDGKSGLKWRENGRASCLSSLDRNSTKSPSHGIKHWQRLIETYETPEFSPDLDWSYLSLTETEKAESKEKINVSVHLNKKETYSPILNHFGVPPQDGMKTHNVFFPYRSSIISPYQPAPNMTESQLTKNMSPISDTGGSIGAPCCHIESLLPCGGYYEKLVDDVLENLDCEVSGSDFSDDDLAGSEVLESPLSSSTSRESYDRLSSTTPEDFQAEYDRHVNTWTTFSTVVNTVDSEDGFSVDDILNDNYIESNYKYSFDEGFKTLQVA